MHTCLIQNLLMQAGRTQGSHPHQALLRARNNAAGQLWWCQPAVTLTY